MSVAPNYHQRSYEYKQFKYSAMAITLTKKQKITRRLYDEFKLNRGYKPHDEYFDYDYACFLEQKIVELMCECKERSNEHNTSNCIKHDVIKSVCDCGNCFMVYINQNGEKTCYNCLKPISQTVL